MQCRHLQPGLKIRKLQRDAFSALNTGRSKIHLNGLPGTRSIPDAKLEAYHVHLVHVQGIPFQEEGKVVEAERHRILKCQKPFRLFNLDAYVNVLVRACSFSKLKLQRDANFSDRNCREYEPAAKALPIKAVLKAIAGNRLHRGADKQ